MPVQVPDPEAAAGAYEALLRRGFWEQEPAFDLVLLGLGSDGHTASVFPSSPALEERTRLVLAVEGPNPPRQRLTLTPRALSQAADVLFLVPGSEKAAAVRGSLEERSRPARWPAQAIVPPHGRVTWWLDRAAAAALAY
jgi:6-phosphogluconolactonase